MALFKQQDCGILCSDWFDSVFYNSKAKTVYVDVLVLIHYRGVTGRWMGAQTTQKSYNASNIFYSEHIR